ncbi:hypothetical protein RRG08_039389 [Elysia crispata]|uniref:Uncharacterized protein n=1 Tax=Elysia crispata TaxID=231223 RepID=A0AAE0XWJ1_9GAST|nr:hypothetical protein RRG08_039389 [Elysia crispata]
MIDIVVCPTPTRLVSQAAIFPGPSFLQRLEMRFIGLPDLQGVAGVQFPSGLSVGWRAPICVGGEPNGFTGIDL